LLGHIGLDFRVIPANVDESLLEGEAPADYVLRLAASKARQVQVLAGAEETVIAADTTVVDGDQILGKPIDAEEARRMLQQLRGRVHRVYTAIAVLHNDQLLTEVCCSHVPMRQYSDTELAAYVASGDPLDKAGAYAIQHEGFAPVENFAGCYANVVGLPLCHLGRALLKAGIAPGVAIPPVCRAALGYECRVYESILGQASA
jgi:MAF protein